MNVELSSLLAYSMIYNRVHDSGQASKVNYPEMERETESNML